MMFNEDVVMSSVSQLIEEPGTETEIIDREYLEMAFQVKIINGKVCYKPSCCCMCLFH